MLGLQLQVGNNRDIGSCMLVSSVLLTTFIGLIANLSFSGLVSQPDWSFAVLLAMLLSQQRTWIWVLPSIGMHDLFLYWSAIITLPVFILISVILFYSDKRLGPGQQQRWLCLLLGIIPLFNEGMAIFNVLLTLAMTVLLWSFFTTRRDKVYVEPA